MFERAWVREVVVLVMRRGEERRNGKQSQQRARFAAPSKQARTHKVK